jgi:hypothetical protein
MDNSSFEQRKTGIFNKIYLGKIFQLIIKRLKTGCQWRELSLKDTLPIRESVGN